MKKLIFVISLVFLSCQSEVRLDVTNAKTAKESFSKMKEGLKEQEVKDLEDAIGEILRENIKESGGLLSLVGKSQEEIMVVGLKGFNNKSRAELLELAAKYKKERVKVELLTAQNELKALKEKKERYDNAMKEVSKIKVVRSKFWKSKSSEYSVTTNPYIKVKVKNGTKKAISRIFFEGTISKKGRKVPYLVKEFNYSIPGGLEPGESQEWTLAPNPYSDWGRAQKPIGSNFTVKVTGFSDHKEERIPKYIDEFDKSDIDKIKTVQAKIDALSDTGRDVATKKD